MRAVAIFGPGFSAGHIKPFRNNCDMEWLSSLPARSGEADAILIFGGDGTIHRHLSQLVQLQLPVLIVPCGSGNDFARALGLRGMRDSLECWRDFLATGNNIKVIDLGIIKPLPQPDAGEAPAPHGHYFCTVAGMGLSSEVTRRANRLPRWLRANGGYALCLLPALLKFAAVQATIAAWSAEGPTRHPRTERAFLAAFANTPAYGGGMKIAPRARLDDGNLDVCVIGEASKFKLCCLFPTVYFGRHLNVAEVEYFSAEGLEIETERPLDIYADGEFVCRTPVDVSIARAALPVIVPPRFFPS
jgi:diacylglycerol kinase (ATP)